MTLGDTIARLGLTWYVTIGLISTGGWLCVLLVYNKATQDRPEQSQRENEDSSHSSESSALSQPSFPGVSILRPMSGLDPDLYACLSSSFQQDYHMFEVILSVKSASDPAIACAKRVMAEHPLVDAMLIVGDVDVGVNPKVNNLIKSYEHSKYDYIWILDSNSWTSPRTLSNSMRHFESARVNLVHHIPIAHASDNAQFGAMLDDVYMGTMHAKMYSVINFLSVAPCVMGKSNILRKSALPEDGLTGFGKFIAEDHLMAVSIWRGRRTHVLANECVRQPLLEVSAKQYCMRRIRWVRVRKYMTTAATLVEPFTECFMLGFIGSLSISKIWHIVWWKIWLVHTLAWTLLDYACWNRLRNYPHDEAPPFSPDKTSSMGARRWTFVWTVREILAFPLWCVAMSGDKIDWRGSQFVINRDMTARRFVP